MANRVVPDRHGLINIGKLKENLVTEVELPAPGFAGGSYAVLLQRPREKEPYPVTARTEGGRLIWTVQTADTAIPGTGKLECRWYGDNGEVDKGQTYMVRITDGLPDTTEAPEAYAGYVAQVARNAEAAKSAASVAGAAAGRAETALKALEDGIASGDFRCEKGEKGDKGDNAYTWIKYASQQPTATSHSMGDIPDAWMGIYTGTLAAAPTDWTQYKWYRVRGDQGATGAPATLTGRSVTYMASDSGTVVPSGSWSSDVPTVTQGRYLWTRVVLTFNSGSPVTYYSVARMGLDGTGSVSAVNGKSPDSTGNVKLTAADITAADGQSIDANLEAKLDKTATVTLTLTAAGWSGGYQTVGANGVPPEGDVLVCPTPESMAAYLRAGIWCAAQQTGALRFGCRITPTEAIQVSVKPFGV